MKGSSLTQQAGESSRPSALAETTMCCPLQALASELGRKDVTRVAKVPIRDGRVTVSGGGMGGGHQLHCQILQVCGDHEAPPTSWPAPASAAFLQLSLSFRIGQT